MNALPWITILTVFPALGGLLLLGMGSGHRERLRMFAAGWSLAILVFALWLWFGFDPVTPGLQFGERHPWMPSVGVEYRVGLDGLSLVMVLLTAFLVPLSVLTSAAVGDRPQLYFAMILFLESALFGSFTAWNFVHWFLYYELSLVPAFLLVRLWGGPNRAAASFQFFVYTMVGSVALLLAFLALRLATGSFDLERLAELGQAGTLASALSVKLGWYALDEHQLAGAICFLAFLGCAVKIPVYPFHSWLPQTYAEAPSSVTLLLTGVMSKLGVYALLRLVLPIFPESLRWMHGPLLALAVLTVVMPAFAAFGQRDIKRILAYSSVNHLGYCLLGVLAVVPLAGTGSAVQAESDRLAAMSGVILQMVNHGLTAGLLFGFVALLEQRTGGLRGLDDFGGLRRRVPVFCGLMGIALFSSLGLPGLNGFVGEFLIFKGAFGQVTMAALFSSVGLLVTAVFLLTLMQKMFHGPLNERWAAMPDLSRTERLVLIPGMVLVFVLGIQPQWVIVLVEQTVRQLTARGGL